MVYSVEMEGPDATQIFAFLMLQRYSEDIIVLKNVPTIRCTVKQADLTQARFGDVIISTLELEDVPCAGAAVALVQAHDGPVRHQERTLRWRRGRKALQRQLRLRRRAYSSRFGREFAG